MTEHPRPLRQGERAPIPRAVDRPAPAPIDVELDETRRRRSKQNRGGHRRSLREWFASKAGRRVLIALVCLGVLLAGLLWQGFLNSPAPDVAPPAAAQVAPSDTLPTPSPSPSSRRTTKGDAATTDQGVMRTLRSKFPYNPLNHLSGDGIHTVVVEVTSATPTPILGWLVPTGLSDSYGSKRNYVGPFSLSQRALGGGYLAAVFIQAGKLGVPVTCRVIVDGRVTSEETTSGAYGRNVCLG